MGKRYCRKAYVWRYMFSINKTKERLMVRVPSEKMKEALSTEFVGPMNFTGKPMKEFIFVTEKGFHTEEKLQHWIEIGVAHAKRKSEQ